MTPSPPPPTGAAGVPKMEACPWAQPGEEHHVAYYAKWHNAVGGSMVTAHQRCTCGAMGPYFKIENTAGMGEVGDLLFDKSREAWNRRPPAVDAVTGTEGMREALEAATDGVVSHVEKYFRTSPPSKGNSDAA